MGPKAAGVRLCSIGKTPAARPAIRTNTELSNSPLSPAELRKTTDGARQRRWECVSDQVPSAVLWSRMSGNRQHPSAKVRESHFPQAFKTALAQDPGAITEAYV